MTVRGLQLNSSAPAYGPVANERKFSTVLVAALLAGCTLATSPWPAQAQTAIVSDATEVFPIWPSSAPGSEHSTWTETTVPAEEGNRTVRNVTVPTLTAFLPEPSQRTGTAVLIAPGGGFETLAIDAEGYSVARRLQARGIAAFVLKYRLKKTSEGGTPPQVPADSHPMKVSGPQRTPDPELENTVNMATADALQAMRSVRRRSSGWAIDPHRIGILGFSAGGQVANAAASGYDAESRPDFAASLYGVPSRNAVPKDAPPLFLAVSADDRAAISGWNIALFRQWRAAGRSAELHIFASGGHGFASAQQGKSSDHWFQELLWWLEAQHLLKPAG